MKYFKIQSSALEAFKKFNAHQSAKAKKDDHFFSDQSKFSAQNTLKKLQKMLQKLKTSVVKNLLTETSSKHASKKPNKDEVSNI